MDSGRIGTGGGRVRFVTFGCKANQYDTQVLREALLRRGWAEAEREAELVVVNTCTVTEDAGKKAIKLVRRLHRESPGTKIALTGCQAESEPELLRTLPGVEWVLGNGEAKRPVHFLRELGEEVDPEELGIPAGITEFAGHTRAFLKIQDGCNQRCAFCIIPSVRGPSRSRPAAELEAEVRRLLAAGHREIVLCGIHIGHWGLDLGTSLADLLERLARIEPDEPDEPGGPRAPRDPRNAPAWRLRLSSIEATEVDGRVLEVLARHPRRIAPHLHLPLQSGDDEILRAMNRWYTADEYLAAVERIRAALDRPAFTADVLVGFPGEEERHFASTLEVVRRTGFARLHVFPFSPRPGTAAWGSPRPGTAAWGSPRPGTAASELGAPPRPEVVRERRARLSELGHELAERYRRSLAGARETVVLEGWSGLSGRYQRVRVDPADLAPDAPPPPLLEVRLELEADPHGGAEALRLRGRPLAEVGA